MTKSKFKKIFTLALLLFTYNSSYSQFYQESYGGELTIGIVRRANLHLNPYNTQSVLDQLIFDLSFKGCLFSNENDDLIPIFVNSYKKVNNKRWNFTLKRSLYFQNGRAILSKDIKASLEYLKIYKPIFINKKIELDNIKQINILGALSFQIVLIKQDKYLIDKLANLPILPEKYIENLIETDPYKRLKILIGSGPFAMSQINDFQGIYFKANKNFYRGRPFLNKIYIKFYQNEQQKISDFLTGKTDLIFFNDFSTAKIINQITQKNNIIYEVKRKFPQLFMILVNQKHNVFRNKTNRKALEFAINKNNIFTNTTPVSIRDFFFDANSDYNNLYIKQRKYDPLKALSLLKSNGWQLQQGGNILKKNKTEFTFTLFFDRGSQLQENIVRNIQIQLAEIGISVVPVPVNPLDKNIIINQEKFGAVLMSIPINEENPLPTYFELYDLFLNKQIKELNIFSKQIKRLNKKLLNNQIKNSVFFKEMHSIFYSNVPIIFLGNQSSSYVAQKSSFRKTRISLRKNNLVYYYLSPIEDWYLPIDFQRQ